MAVKNSNDIYRKLILLMMQAKRHLAKLCEERDITPVQGILLFMFGDGVSKSMNDLSCKMGCDASNTTGLVDRLDASGLIERTVDPADRRVKMVKLSKKGLHVRQELIEGLRQAEALDLQKLTDDEQKQFLGIINKLTSRST